MKKLEDTQEIKIPRSELQKNDYGDNFEGKEVAKIHKQQTTTKKTSKNSKKLCIIIASVAAIIILTVITIVTSCSSTPATTRDTSSVAVSSNTKVISTTYTNYVAAKTFNEKATESVTTKPSETTEVLESTAVIPTTENQTEEITQVVETTAVTSEKSELQVSDILIYVDPEETEKIAIAKVSGNFSGYSAEELLKKVTVSTDGGNPNVSLPYLEENSFTFNIYLKECKGLLHINMEGYDFYQPLDTIINLN